MSNSSAEGASKLENLLTAIYGGAASDILPQIMRLVEKYRPETPPEPRPMWDETDITLITYGDQISHPGEASLDTLGRFISQYDLAEGLSIVHILPFCPYSSDDGFSVIDFRAIDAHLGDWPNLEKLAEQVDLMYDLVLNHVSQHSDWFQGYLQGEEKYQGWFHAVDPSLDLSAVTRPRSHPLLTTFTAADGSDRAIWTTFSADQIDLNYSDPGLLLEMLDILLMYVDRGARIVRLDAIAFLWKEIGTTCLHLEKTHLVVKLMRCVVEMVAPQAILLTETNVPHPENISYFGDGDEAHMVYNFSLPPLLFDAYVQNEATPLADWLTNLQPPGAGKTWFNFTASHDGIGVRPLEGLVEGERFEQLVQATRDRGGKVSMRVLPNGDLRPYELNITWRAAMWDDDAEVDLNITRMLASQAFMLAVQGVPAPYFHSLVGSPNDIAGMKESGHNRRINRKKYTFEELTAELDKDTVQAAIFKQYQHLLKTRRGQKAFHPDATQRVVPTGNPAAVAFERTSVDGGQKILVVANFASTPVQLTELPAGRDLISGEQVDLTSTPLAPCQIVWLEVA